MENKLSFGWFKMPRIVLLLLLTLVVGSFAQEEEGHEVHHQEPQLS